MSRAMLYVGDVRDVLRGLPEGLVQTCVTSPPYWGLRDYGACPCGSGRFHEGQGDGGENRNYRIGRANLECLKCGGSGRLPHAAAQFGLEPTPDEYVAHMVEVFREVKRVLRDDGTLWLNLGDSYGQGGGKQVVQTKNASHGLDGMRQKTPGFAAKQLIGIPWRVAFALQADGWYLRSDIIWSKPNPMPESVRDRPTKAHEYLFLLSKSERYYYDAETIAEDTAKPEYVGRQQATWGSAKKSGRTMGRSPSGNEANDAPYIGMATRNARSVWTIATTPYPGAHFATFPTELARRCILAGSKQGDTVLDPFGGSGTTAAVAVGHGRSAIHIDLNPAYLPLAQDRIGPMLCDVVGVEV